jgi:hypothetical protein
MPKVSEMTPIESSMFSHHHYEPNTRKMTVRYKKSGDLWEHDDVGMDKHTTFAANASPGRYFNEKIKPNHIGRKVSE